jgi:hypothetical protein
LENEIISVERILQYISIPEEPPLSISEDKLARSWPSEGEIQLQNLHVNLHNIFVFYILLLFCFSCIMMYGLNLKKGDFCLEKLHVLTTSVTSSVLCRLCSISTFAKITKI